MFWILGFCAHVEIPPDPTDSRTQIKMAFPISSPINLALPSREGPLSQVSQKAKPSPWGEDSYLDLTFYRPSDLPASGTDSGRISWNYQTSGDLAHSPPPFSEI